MISRAIIIMGLVSACASSIKYDCQDNAYRNGNYVRDCAEKCNPSRSTIAGVLNSAKHIPVIEGDNSAHDIG